MPSNNIPSQFPNNGNLPLSNSASNKNNISANAQTAAIIFDIKKKKLKVTRSKIKDIAKGLAEIAQNIGSTNDRQEYAKLLEEDIWEGLKIAQKRQENKSSY